MVFFFSGDESARGEDPSDFFGYLGVRIACAPLTLHRIPLCFRRCVTSVLHAASTTPELTTVGGSSASAISYKRYLVDSQGRSFAQPTRLRLPSLRRRDGRADLIRTRELELRERLQGQARGDDGHSRHAQRVGGEVARACPDHRDGMDDAEGGSSSPGTRAARSPGTGQSLARGRARRDAARGGAEGRRRMRCDETRGG